MSNGYSSDNIFINNNVGLGEWGPIILGRGRRKGIGTITHFDISVIENKGVDGRTFVILQFYRGPLTCFCVCAWCVLSVFYLGPLICFFVLFIKMFI